MPVGVTSPIADTAAETLWWGDFDSLEAQYRAVRLSTERVDGGTVRLQWFRSGLARVFGESDATDPYFAQLEALTYAWAVERPGSALAQLLYARALYARAWSFRGDDYASKVPAAAMGEYQRYIKLALEQLTTHAELLKGESTASTYLAMIGRNLGWNYETLHALALEALARNPADEGAFQELANASVPKWGGNARRFDAVVREATRRVLPDAGMAMYAFLYDDAAEAFDGELFSASDVDWPTMRRGFNDWLARWPSEYMLNRFALDACRAQDKPTTVELLDRVGAKPLARAWGNRFEACRRWARSP